MQQRQGGNLARRRFGAGAVLALLVLVGCRRAHQVGDHVLVDWRGADYPAVIIAVEGPSKFHVHFDGYSDDWDETLPATRIRGRLSTAPVLGPPGLPPSQFRNGASASGSAAPLPPSVYHVGDRVRVEWHGSTYQATILTTLGEDRYRIHYEGYGNEWDEDIAMSRIQRKGN